MSQPMLQDYVADGRFPPSACLRLYQDHPTIPITRNRHFGWGHVGTRYSLPLCPLALLCITGQPFWLRRDPRGHMYGPDLGNIISTLADLLAPIYIVGWMTGFDGRGREYFRLRYLRDELRYNPLELDQFVRGYIDGHRSHRRLRKQLPRRWNRAG